MPDTSSFPRFLVVCADNADDAGQVPDVLEQAECQSDIVCRWGQGGTVAFDPERHRGLILMGDGQDRASASCYAREQEWARIAIERGLPVLGVCHGAQLLAHLYGGHLSAPNRSRNIDEGLGELSLTDAGRQDPLLQQVPAGGMIYQYHCETFTVPPGAVNLANSSSRRHPHSDAFRIGDRVYGLQFHPELRAETLASWLGLPGSDESGERVTLTGRSMLAAWVRLALAAPDPSR
ncbi:MAG: glutamine amidotransferase class-I [Gemmataceae bacterium]|nr:glutamine amidotransferase class-I [Gemmataceae bacterium]